MPISRKLALDDAQVEEILTTTWNCRIATLGPKGRINLTPMWFGWAGGKVYIYGRGQKVENLRRDPACTILIDHNARWMGFTPKKGRKAPLGAPRLVSFAALENS